MSGFIKQKEDLFGNIIDYGFAHKMMSESIFFTIYDVIKKYKKHIKNYKGYYENEELYANTTLYLLNNNTLSIFMNKYDWDEKPYLTFYVNNEKMKTKKVKNYYGDKKLTFINKKHKFIRKEWKSSSLSYDRMSLEDISILYLENCRMASLNNKNIDCVVNNVHLDNGKDLRLDLNVSLEEFRKGSFDRNNIVLRIYEYNELVDWLHPEEYIKEVREDVYKVDRKFKRLFKYQTSKSSVQEMIDNKEKLRINSDENLSVEEKIEQLKDIRKQILDLSYRVSVERNSNALDQMVFSDWKVPIDEDLLLIKNEDGYKEVREEFKPYLKYLDLSNIDFTCVDYSDLDLRFCNVLKLEKDSKVLSKRNKS